MAITRIILKDITYNGLVNLNMDIPMDKNGVEVTYDPRKLPDGTTDLHIITKLVSKMKNGRLLGLQIDTVFNFTSDNDSIRPTTETEYWYYAEFYVIAQSHARMLWKQYKEQHGITTATLLPQDPLGVIYQRIKDDALRMWN